MPPRKKPTARKGKATPSKETKEETPSSQESTSSEAQQGEQQNENTVDMEKEETADSMSVDETDPQETKKETDKVADMDEGKSEDASILVAEDKTEEPSDPMVIELSDVDIIDEIKDSSVEETEATKSDNQQDGEDKTAEGDEEDKAGKLKNSWVDIIEKERDGKLHAELSKIGKLIPMQQKGKEIHTLADKHRLHIFPMKAEDLANEYINGLIQKCARANMRFFAVPSDGQGKSNMGCLELTFMKQHEADENKTKLAEYREGISVYSGEQSEEFKKAFNNFIGLTDVKNNRLTLFAPSLPDNVTEDELYGLFPRARELWLVPGTPRQHAYIKFKDEETLQTSIDELKARGPPREDFNFCRLVRYHDVARVVQMYRDINRQRHPGSTNQKYKGPTASRFQRLPTTRAPQKSPRARNVKPRLPDTKGSSARPDTAEKPEKTDKPRTTTTSRPNREQSSAVARTNATNSRRQQWYADIRARNLERARRTQRPRNRMSRPGPQRPPFEASFSQFQRDSQQFHQKETQQQAASSERQQGLEMLGSLLSTLGQLSSSRDVRSAKDTVSGAGIPDRPRMDSRSQRPNMRQGFQRTSPTKRGHSPDMASMSKRYRRPDTGRHKRVDSAPAGYPVGGYQNLGGSFQSSSNPRRDDYRGKDYDYRSPELGRDYRPSQSGYSPLGSGSAMNRSLMNQSPRMGRDQYSFSEQQSSSRTGSHRQSYNY